MQKTTLKFYCKLLLYYLMEDSENNDTREINDKTPEETIGDTIEKENEKVEDDKYIVYLISINDKSENEVRNLLTLKVNKDKIKNIKDIKYYIIDSTKADIDLCPCFKRLQRIFS